MAKSVRSALWKVRDKESSVSRETGPVGDSSDLVSDARAAGMAEPGSARGSARSLGYESTRLVRPSKYLEFILEREEPKDWRAELAELLDLLKIEKKVSIKGYCQSCSGSFREPILVCPNCNGIGTFKAIVAGSTEGPGTIGTNVGTQASDLFGDLVA